MRKIIAFLLALSLVFLSCGCTKEKQTAQVTATTAPVYEFAVRICQGTDIQVSRLITENVSCLHDYTLQTSQMRALESAELVLISGAGLEDFLNDVLPASDKILDSSQGITLLCGEHEQDHEDHSHDHSEDPHIWLSPANAKVMAKNIYDGLVAQYPQHQAVFRENLKTLTADLTKLEQYATQQLSNIACRELITFHDGFAYLADAFDLHILFAIEEESGSEASARELIEIASLIQAHHLSCIFTEVNGSTSASLILSAETGVHIYSLDMAMGDRDYFSAMYHNIDTLKEALQ